MKDGVHIVRENAGEGLRVLISSYRSHPHVGGQGVYVRELATSLQAQGCQVSVISGPPYPDLPAEIALIELPSLNLFEEDNALLALRWSHLWSKADRSEWLAHNTGAFGEMRAFAFRLNHWLKNRADNFDVIHDNQTLASPMIEVAGQIPLLTTLHHPIAIDLDFALQGADKWWKRLLSKRWHSFIHEQARTGQALDHFICVSKASRQAYAERCGMNSDQVSVSYNGIDQEAFQPSGSEQREDNLIVAMASADVPIKGLDVLIDAFAQLAPDRPDLRLEVIGTLRDGPTQRSLERHHLKDRVHFKSGLPRDEVASLFRKASVFVSPSRFEGFGFPQAEAMACGAPVIVSDGGALPEVAGDAGIVTPVGDVEALAEALRSVLSDPSKRQEMSDLGIERAQSIFRWDQHAADTIALYKSMLAESVS